MPQSSNSKLNSADVAALIRDQILKGILQPQDRLPPERRLAEEFGVARGTIRQALNRLEDQSLVETRPGSGTYVADHSPRASGPAIDNTTPLELMDVRFSIEPHVCRLVVLNGRRSDFDQLEALCDTMSESLDDPIAFSAADTAFHKKLVQSTRNGLLIWMMDQITSVRNLNEWQRMRRLTLNQDVIVTYNRQHRDILTAIRNREPEEAARLMKVHLETARLSLTRAAQA